MTAEESTALMTRAVKLGITITDILFETAEERREDLFLILPLKSSKAPTNYFTPNILRKSWSRLVVSVVHLDALAFPVAAT